MATILIVDDEASVRRLMRRFFDGLGHDVIEAACADDALRAIETRPVAVVFCDIQMPGRDGLWLAAELRRRYRTTAIVLATGMNTVPAQISMQAGILAYLVKPFRRESVIDALEAALRWHDGASVSGSPAGNADHHQVQQWLDSLEISGPVRPQR